ncbi:hypothetical protein DFP72DRAFT_1076461 [Ephemerocybe angulata]|uniref:Uncharacterized protein n=1 Tax=Ephemerocybe angulata TaxID=980116 RepID=A0A8H6HIB7_9AGAR|nr:hypothetical protein DFP72DRAFT_1076461 [Tulosesus angulatus]
MPSNRNHSLPWAPSKRRQAIKLIPPSRFLDIGPNVINAPALLSSRQIAWPSSNPQDPPIPTIALMTFDASVEEYRSQQRARSRQTREASPSALHQRRGNRRALAEVTNSTSNPASQLRPPAEGTENRSPNEQNVHYPATPVSQANRRSEAARRVWERRRQAQASAAASSNTAQTPNEEQASFCRPLCLTRS